MMLVKIIINVLMVQTGLCWSLHKSKTITWPDYPDQSLNDTAKGFYDYLCSNLMECDIINAGTLGCSSYRQLPDGLTVGVVHKTIENSILAKSYPWTNAITRGMYLEYVVNFASLNEPRTNYMEYLNVTLEPVIHELLLNPETAIEDVVYTINANVWTLLGNITFESGLTPVIIDPMSVITYGHASCTGLSILFVSCLRVLGVPARIAGTPAWNGDPANGNHNWVEFFSTVENEWKFVESAPSYGSVPPRDASPCIYYVCRKNYFDRKTKVYAARFNKNTPGFFPLAWDFDNFCVPGEDRTDFMSETCSQCRKKSDLF